MLHIFYGNNTVGVRNRAHGFADSLLGTGVGFSRIDADSYEASVLRDALSAVSLFGEKVLYVLDTPGASEVFAQEVLSLLEEFHTSVHDFVVIEGTLLPPAKKTYAKYADTFEETTGEKKEAFNVFVLSDSLARKDKKSLWLGLCEARRRGLSPEEIIGTLWWQLKTLRLAAFTRNAAEAGMKDFPYNKAKRSLSLFKEGELQHLAQTLLAAYHEGHQGETDIDLSLERWVLTV